MRHTLHKPHCEFLRREIAAAAARPTTPEETPMGYDPAHDYDDNPPIMNHPEGAPHSPGVSGRTCGRCLQPIKADEINTEVEPGRYIHVMCPSYHYTLREETTGDRARDICNRAADLVNNDRNAVYGDAEVNFRETGALWAVVFGHDVTPEQVALCLDLLKTARLIHNPNHADSWVDKVGYSALGGGIAARPRTNPEQ
ncbi:hypothetical protein SEA_SERENDIPITOUS_55 [Mycobacterium phage Serendipitous]|uniref:DUF6378 domain-containing protein n=1 Tax=Mycobacterium phage Serendipitous TaxID=2301619 RepID=A0A385UHF2_9CAUD|nr:hypothetical protein I5G64_gp55 [Mycobacterium phage Serendipitous]AYB70596.1 hypothetical protein SEA_SERENDIPITOUS_55 [Mycobacterium phage Serendipitous]